MDDRERELERSSKKILEKGVSDNPGKNLGDIGLAQQQLSTINQQHAETIKDEQAALSAQTSQRAAVNQAAQIGVQSAVEAAQNAQQENSGVQQVASMNPQTQALLRQYGIDPNAKNGSNPTSHTTTNTKSREGRTSVENVTNTTTTTRNEIKIIQPNIPISNPNIKVQDPNTSLTKFNSWLQKTNAEQDGVEDREKREFDRRERSLGRLTSKLMKKIEDMTTNIGSYLDPSRIAKVEAGSFKTMLFQFAMAILPIIWDPLMERIASFEAGVKTFFGWDMNEASSQTGGSLMVQSWKRALGASEEEIRGNKSVLSILGGLVQSAWGEAKEKLDLWFKDRGELINRIKQPEDGSIGDWLGYIGKVIKTIFKGHDAEIEEAGKEQEKSILTGNGYGSQVIERGNYKGQSFSTEDGEINKDGTLSTDANTSFKATTLAGQKLTAGIKKGNVDGKSLLMGLNNARETAQKLGSVPISTELLNNIASPDELKVLRDKKELFPGNDKYKWIKVPAKHYTTTSKEAIANTHMDGWTEEEKTMAQTSTQGSGRKSVEAKWKLVPIDQALDPNFNNPKTDERYDNNILLITKRGLDTLLGTTGESSLYTKKSYDSIIDRIKKKTKKKFTVNTSKNFLKAVGSAKSYENSQNEINQQNTQINRALGTADTSLAETEYYSKSDQYAVPDMSVNIPQSTNGNIVTAGKFLISKGLTKEQAAGVIGNFMQESGMNPYVKEGGKETRFNPNSSGGWGIAQWTSKDRKRNLYNFVGGSDLPTLEQQLEFVWKELSGNSGNRNGNLRKLMSTTTPSEAAKVFEETYERAGKPNLPRRMGFAEQAYKILSSMGNTVTSIDSNPTSFGMSLGYNPVNTPTVKSKITAQTKKSYSNLINKYGFEAKNKNYKNVSPILKEVVDAQEAGVAITAGMSKMNHGNTVNNTIVNKGKKSGKAPTPAQTNTSSKSYVSPWSNYSSSGFKK